MTGSLTGYIDAIGRSPALLDGNLSFSHGFLPQRLTGTELPAQFQPWHSSVLELQNSAHTGRARQFLDTMPVLPATADALPDRHVKWSAVLLGILAHAYWWFDTQSFLGSVPQDPRLPECIAVPWTEICARLGRRRAFYSFEDAFFQNFAFPDGRCAYTTEEVSVPDVQRKVSPWGTRMDRIFYPLFAELHAKFTPVVRLMPDLENACEPGEFERIFLVIASVVEELTRTLRKLSAKPGSGSYCDPAEWARLIGVFDRPGTMDGKAGPNGAAAPFVHVLDAIIGRTTYRNPIALLSRDMRNDHLPRTHALLFDLVAGLRLRELLDTRRGDPAWTQTTAAWGALGEAWSGPHGWLAAHESKMIAYLSVAAHIDRAETSSLFPIEDEAWRQVAEELEQARLER